MELSGTGRARRNGAITQTAQKTARGTGKTPAQGQRVQARADRLTLSRQVLNLLEEQNRRVEEEARQESGANEERMLGYLEKSLKELKTCQTISARITAGDKVPDEDLRYLMTHDPDGYRLALAMRTPKADPQKWESALDDEQKEEMESGEVTTSGVAEGKTSSASAGPAG